MINKSDFQLMMHLYKYHYNAVYNFIVHFQRTSLIRNSGNAII